MHHMCMYVCMYLRAGFLHADTCAFINAFKMLFLQSLSFE